jgi:hypothetical protein
VYDLMNPEASLVLAVREGKLGSHLGAKRFPRSLFLRP